MIVVCESFFIVCFQVTSSNLEYYLRWTLALLQSHGPYIQSNGNMSLTESLRSLLRALTIHEKEIFKIASDNLFTLNFIHTQFSPTRNDSIVELEQEEKLKEQQQAQQYEEQQVEDDVGAMDVVEGDDADWSAAWKDEDDEVAGDAVAVESFINMGASHFADIAHTEEEEKKSKKSSKRSRSKK